MKIVEFQELVEQIGKLKSEGKKIVHCHGCFDLMHPGHIKYFQAAKKMGNVLVVTITPDEYVDKGPGRPVFNQYLRVDSIAALECVDYAAINKWPTAEETLRLIRPDIYVKGQEFEKLEDKTGKIQKEYEIVKEIGAELKFTHEIIFSSTDLLNKHFHPQINTDKELKFKKNLRKFVDNKILSFDNLVEKVKNLKQEGKIIVQSHGIFDLIHPGIIRHLNEAKKQGDIMVVTVIKDEHVRKMPGRPVFPGKMRLENAAFLTQVDYVCLVDDNPPFHCVKLIEPDVFAKGKDYLERDKQIHGEGLHSTENNIFSKSRIYETNGFSFSSSQIINSLLDIYPEKTKTYIREFSRKYDFNDIVDKMNSLKGMKVLLIGDGIIDEYHYCESMGKSPKVQLIVNKYLTHETFAGGAFAITNHIAGICDNIHLVTLLGKEESREDFIVDNLKPNVSTKFFYREDGPTIIKKRYINQYQNQKIFEVNYLDDNINNILESEIIDYLKSVITDYDLVLVSDFGHGLITNKIIRTIENTSKKLAVNSQTNGANSGYNLITKYNKVDFICLDDPEARLATQMKYDEIEYVGKNLLKNIATEYLIITIGSAGSLCINKEGIVNRTPAFATKVVDIIGAGDAFFSYAAPCFAIGMPMELISFISNAVGALAVQIVGNKRSVEKYEVLEFIHTILK